MEEIERREKKKEYFHMTRESDGTKSSIPDCNYLGFTCTALGPVTEMFASQNKEHDLTSHLSPRILERRSPTITKSRPT